MTQSNQDFVYEPWLETGSNGLYYVSVSPDLNGQNAFRTSRSFNQRFVVLGSQKTQEFGIICQKSKSETNISIT